MTQYKLSKGPLRPGLQGKATSAGLLPLSSLPKPLTLPHPRQRGLAGRPQTSHGPQGLLKQMVGPWLKGHRRPHQCNYTTSLQLERTLRMTCSLYYDSCVMWSLYASPPCHRWGCSRTNNLTINTCQTDFSCDSNSKDHRVG